MNKRTVALTLPLIGSLALIACGGGANTQGPLMLDSFENELTKQTVDFGSSADSVVEVVASDRSVCGDQSLQLNYDLGESGYMYVARGYGLDAIKALWEGPPPDDVDWTQYTGVSLQVYGNATGQIAVDVKDSGNELHRVMITDDFEGWQEVVIPFGEFKAREDWQPNIADRNQSLDFPIQSFQFEHKTPGKGTVLFDCVQAVR
jgi:beta-glucosidase